ncbi:hypothetical protein Gotri_005599 [Gossypium trilobum]|uniref:Uncharacterized protein n=1 Tax=Gossypium trilobum TaxID=34281 RepID=A0A7J9EY15_9ROSI|nr:hypothetical protein [Gossypium trilobum]
MEVKEIWTSQKGTTIPKTFNQALMTPKGKSWIKNMVECKRIWKKEYYFPI